MRVRNGPWIALGAVLALALAAAWLFHETRATTFWADEWIWIQDRRETDVATFLEPHNGHLSLVPVAVYKVLFATAGLTEYWPYRLLIIAAHLCCVVLVFAYCRPRVGVWPSGVAAVLVLGLGPAWQNILWPFQIGSVTSLAAGVGALLALDRGDRRGDVAACALVALSLASTATGVVMALGVAIDLLITRRRPRDLWIVAVPAVPFAIWWLAYEDSPFVRHNVVLAPGFAADAAAGALAALTGLAGNVLAEPGSALAWGRPLAALAMALLVWRLVTVRPLPTRAVTLLVTVLALWLLTGVQRAQLGSPDSSRYVYAGAVLCVLLAAELARGVAIPRRALGLLTAGAALAALANVGDMRDAARLLRDQAAIARADLAALELARPVLPEAYVAAAFPGRPFITISAPTYFDAAEALGSPAYTPAQLARAPEPARQAADLELASARGAALVAPAGGLAPGMQPPRVDKATGGRAIPAGGCVRFAPEAARAPDSAPELELELPPGGMRLTTRGGGAGVSLRRLAAGFPAEPLSRMAPDSTALLRLPADEVTTPWHVRVAPDAAVTACTQP